MAATKLNLVIERGKTFTQDVRWEQEPFLFSPITSISKSAPVRITTSAPHTIPNGWRVAVVGAKGLTNLNAGSNPPKDVDFRKATVVDATTIEFNELVSTEWSAHTAATGHLQFYTPTDLTGFTARMSIKDSAGGSLLHSLTSASGITINVAGKVISVSIDAVTTAGFAWTSGVYDLEMVSAGGAVTAVIAGKVSVTPEVTT